MKSPVFQRKINAFDWFCLRAIDFYQRQISPRKGYRCAHARLYGGAGCSGFAREAIAQPGIGAALPQVRARFGECKLAAQTLCAQRVEDSANSKIWQNWQGKLEDICCVDFSWICCADSLLDGSACEAASRAESGCAHGACADASCSEAACGCHACW